MKNPILLALTVVLLLAFATCDKDPDPCDCDPTAHLGIDETCDCGGKDCGCTEQFAYLDTGNTIKIRKEAGISVADMNSAVTIIKNAYTANTNNLNGKITAVHVTITGKTWRYDANKIIWMKLDEVNGAGNFKSFLDSVRDGGLVPGAESND
jgi:hypothetical protein